MPKKERVAPGLGIAPAPARPAEGGRDPFVQFTGNAASTPLRQLASSLSRFGEQGSKFAAERQKAQQESQSEAGRIAFLEALEDQKDTAKAIASLKMRPQQSKWFRWGVQSAAGKADALRARDYFYAEYGDQIDEARELGTYDDLAAKALDEYRGTTEYSEAYDNGFYPGYMAVMESGRYEFARGLDGKLAKDRLDSFEQINHSEMAGWLDREQDRGDLAAEITRQLDVMWGEENPQLYTEMQEIVVQNLKALSAGAGDISIIDIAKDIKIGGEQEGGFRASLWERYRGGPDGLETALSSQLVAEGTRRTAEEQERLYLIHKKQLALEEEMTVYLIAGGRAGENIRPIQDIISDAFGVSTTTGLNLQAQLEKREAFVDFTDQNRYDSIQTDIWSGDGSSGQILNARDSLSEEDANNLLGQLRAFRAEQDRNDGGDKSLLKDTTFTPYINDLGKAFGEDTVDFTEAKGNRLRQARARLRREISQNTPYLRSLSEVDQQIWLAQHADASAQFYKGRLQLQIEAQGFEDTPRQPTFRASQAELEADFGYRYDEKVSNWATVFGMDFDGAEDAAGFFEFERGWNAARPDALVGTQDFLVEWTLYKNKRAGASVGAVQEGDVLPTPVTPAEPIAEQEPSHGTFNLGDLELAPSEEAN